MTFEEFRKQYKEELEKLSPTEKENLALLGLWMVKRSAKLIVEISNRTREE